MAKRSAAALAQAMRGNPASTTKQAVAKKARGTRLDPDAKLAALLAKRDWTSKDRRAWEAFGAKLPAGIDMALVERAVARQIVHGPSWVRGLDARCDDLIVRYAESRTGRDEPDDTSWMFVAVAMRTGRFSTEARHRELSALLDLLDGQLRGDGMRDELAALIGGHPERVEAARAAFAFEVSRPDREPWYDLESEFLPILAADGTADSLDLLLPYFDAALTTGKDFDRVRENIVPLLPATPATAAFAAQFAALFAERRSDTIAEVTAFVRGLGIADPPPIIAFTANFRDREKHTTFKLVVDSTREHWFRGTHSFAPAVFPTTLAAALPATTHDVTLRTQHGLAREAIDRWLRAQLPTKRKLA